MNNIISQLEILSVENGDMIPFFISFIGSVLMVYQIISTIFENIGNRFKVKDKEKQVVDIKNEIIPENNIRLVIMKQLKLATAREEIILLQSKTRGDLLYRIGAFFLIISILCPISATFIYCTLDPVPISTINKLVELKKILTELPKELNINIGRDWHILFGGITFGFLCLAAAKGILEQQAREMSNYFNVAERVGYFELLSSVAMIKFNIAGDDREKEERIVEFISDNLINHQKLDALNNTKDDAFENDNTYNISKALDSVPKIIKGLTG